MRGSNGSQTHQRGQRPLSRGQAASVRREARPQLVDAGTVRQEEVRQSGRAAQADRVRRTRRKQRPSVPVICPTCAKPTYFEGNNQVPGIAYGKPVQHLPAELDEVYTGWKAD